MTSERIICRELSRLFRECTYETYTRADGRVAVCQSYGDLSHDLMTVAPGDLARVADFLCVMGGALVPALVVHYLTSFGCDVRAS